MLLTQAIYYISWYLKLFNAQKDLRFVISHCILISIVAVVNFVTERLIRIEYELEYVGLRKYSGNEQNYISSLCNRTTKRGVKKLLITIVWKIQGAVGRFGE